jgi:hypothetical protein
LETLKHLKEQDSGSVWFTRNGVHFLLHSKVVGLYWNLSVVSFMQVVFWIKRISTWFLFIWFGFRHLQYPNGKWISSDYLNEFVQCKCHFYPGGTTLSLLMVNNTSIQYGML